mmetsp:Transcript_8330/g.10112  ORF Transcript_8330/g.10112 Transcript_8330/m.10112 type:complete len:142 (-) Transcript_8330:293-718(-)
MTIFTPAAAMNPILNGIATHTSGLWLAYWFPTILYLISVPMAFKKNNRVSHIISLCFAFLSLLWHLISFFMYISGNFEAPTAFAETKASVSHAIFWFIELILFAFIFATHLRITVAQGGFVKLTNELVDEIELSEFHYLVP